MKGGVEGGREGWRVEGRDLHMYWSVCTNTRVV